jgi:hypothetical protein
MDAERRDDQARRRGRRADTAEPLVNAYLEVGDRVAVVGRRRRAAFDSTAGLAALGPATSAGTSTSPRSRS